MGTTNMESSTCNRTLLLQFIYTMKNGKEINDSKFLSAMVLEPKSLHANCARWKVLALLLDFKIKILSFVNTVAKFIAKNASRIKFHRI